ncbi:MAG: hypothetical protein AAGI17_01395 [Planctomycetota bacterium]
MTAERLTIIVDWSAASLPGPGTDSPDQCWISWREGEAEYFRTRSACIERVGSLLRAHDGPALVGFDFPLGYPVLDSGEPILPCGRGLAAMLAERTEDDDNNANNRFEVAAELNREIAGRFGLGHGPFWGCTVEPPEGLTRTRMDSGVPEHRRCEMELLELKLRPQSAWKLAYPASVGSQTLTGMPRLHELATDDVLGDRVWFWPFENPPERPDAVAIAEVWPGLHSFDHIDHPIKDARQVIATRHALHGIELRPPRDERERLEGGILGA